MNKSIHALLSLIVALVMLLDGVPSALALATSSNPLVDPKPPVPIVETEDEFLNILIMGIDHGYEGYWGSGGKRKFEEGRSDQNIVVS